MDNTHRKVPFTTPFLGLVPRGDGGATAGDSGRESESSPELASQVEPPLSRTFQYRKVMKPLLERKRRARINKCLDSLKDLMVSALQTEGESITKLEKADVLELTVKHLSKLKQRNTLGLTPKTTYAGQFKAGYAHCAKQVSVFLSSNRYIDPSAVSYTHLTLPTIYSV